MLQVLNGRERNQAFIQFLLFFVLTTALIVGAIYFNFEVPETEKNQLREEVSAYRAESLNQQKFVSQMEETRTFLDSLSKTGINPAQVNAQLTLRLTDLEKLRQASDSGAYGKLNNAVIKAFIELQEAKGQLNSASGKDNLLNDLRTQLAICNQRLDSYVQAYGKMNTQQ